MSAVLGGLAWLTLSNPPLRKIERGNIGIRVNQLTGAATTVNDGAVFVLPGVHTLRQLPRLDQLYKPASADESPYQSVEGLALGVDLTVRYAFDPARIVIALYPTYYPRKASHWQYVPRPPVQP